MWQAGVSKLLCICHGCWPLQSTFDGSSQQWPFSPALTLAVHVAHTVSLRLCLFVKLDHLLGYNAYVVSGDSVVFGPLYISSLAGFFVGYKKCQVRILMRIHPSTDTPGLSPSVHEPLVPPMLVKTVRQEREGACKVCHTTPAGT